jgi:hypothetical protein
VTRLRLALLIVVPPVDNVHCLYSTCNIVAGEEQELPYRVEMWDDHDAHVEELIALVVDHAVARAAFAEAVKRRPGKLITLRQKSGVLADSRG